MDANKIVQSFWSGPVTTMEKLCIKSYIANGHEFHLYTYEGELWETFGKMSGCVVKDANEIVSEKEMKNFWCLQNYSDFFRVTLLLKYGGWWVDLDNICLKHYDFPDEYVFADSVAPPNAHIIQTNVMKVPAHSQLMHYWLA